MHMHTGMHISMRRAHLAPQHLCQSISRTHACQHVYLTNFVLQSAHGNAVLVMQRNANGGPLVHAEIADNRTTEPSFVQTTCMFENKVEEKKCIVAPGGAAV